MRKTDNSVESKCGFTNTVVLMIMIVSLHVYLLRLGDGLGGQDGRGGGEDGGEGEVVDAAHPHAVQPRHRHRLQGRVRHRHALRRGLQPQVA